MNIMHNINKIMIILGSCFAVIASILILSSMVSEPFVEQIVIEKERVMTLVPLGDGNPGDNSGLFYFMIYPHQADPATAYASNLSNASAYEFSDVGNASCTGETPYNTAFDVILKVGVTDDDGKNTTTGFYDPSYVWLTITCADLSIGADTNMTEIHLGNTSTYGWWQYYMNNGGAGYTVTEGQDFNITSTKFWVMRIV